MGADPSKRADVGGLGRLGPIGYLRALEVLENTVRMAFLMLGVRRKTAKATNTINITYSTMVWPSSSLRENLFLKIETAFLS